LLREHAKYFNMEKYYVIPDAIAEQYQSLRKDTSVTSKFKNNRGLNFRLDNKDRYVINVDCGEQFFPEIPWSEFEQIELTLDDFPKEEEI
jgi:hypothetical protein